MITIKDFVDLNTKIKTIRHVPIGVPINASLSISVIFFCFFIWWGRKENGLDNGIFANSNNLDISLPLFRLVS